MAAAVLFLIAMVLTGMKRKCGGRVEGMRQEGDVPECRRQCRWKNCGALKGVERDTCRANCRKECGKNAMKNPSTGAVVMMPVDTPEILMAEDPMMAMV